MAFVSNPRAARQIEFIQQQRERRHRRQHCRIDIQGVANNLAAILGSLAGKQAALQTDEGHRHIGLDRATQYRAGVGM